MPDLVAPFPYFGGKRRAAHLVWNALGDPAGFGGGLASAETFTVSIMGQRSGESC